MASAALLPPRIGSELTGAHRVVHGVYGSVTEIAEAEKISKSYVSRILRLALLAPDIVEAILGGWADQRVMLERLERPLPMGWEEQRERIIS